MPKSVYVAQLVAGSAVESEFVVTSASVHEYSKGYRLVLRLADRTGKVDAVCWDCGEDAANRFPLDHVVRISGTVGTFRDRLQITVQSAEPVDPASVDPADFLPVSRHDPAVMEQALRALVETIAHDGLRGVCLAFLDSEHFQRLRTAPGGKRWHHGYLHGLLEHTLSVVQVCDRLCEHYTELDRNVLLCAALLHDVGKTRELRAELAIDYTMPGRLLGHQVLTIPIVTGLLARAENVPPRLAVLVVHAIAAHHGEEDGSLVKPMTREAAVLHFVDHMDATLNAWAREIDHARDENHEFTDYVRLIDRFLYAGLPDPPAATEPESQA